jgi:CRP/FNR family cyclic AMP-dependent transcriptional regulator
MGIGELGRMYNHGECIVRQGEKGNCMHIVQRGQVEVVLENGNAEILLSVLKKGDVFGEMALFTGEPRSATVRARGKARVLTIDKRGFLKRIHQDPSLGFRILQKMSERIQELNKGISRLKE